MKKILVIDDEAPMRESIVQALTIHSFETIQADNGKAGVRLAMEHLPDLILCDIRMESFDGFAALAALRYQPITATTPVILMTGKPDESGRRMAMELGADDYLKKPFSVSSLLASVHIQLKKKEAIRRQALNYEPSEADQREINAVAEAALDQDPEEGIGGAKLLGHEPMSTPGVLETLERGVLSVESDAAEQNIGPALEILLRILNTYHPNLGNVAWRATVLCEAVAKMLGFSADARANLVRAAGLCDIALVGLNHFTVRRWLRNPDHLQKHEWVSIQEHPEQAELLLGVWHVFHGAGGIIRSHHENWDGTGFPDGIAEEQIPWPARLLAVANLYCSRYDTPKQILEELELHSGTQFDPRAIECVAKAVQLTNLPSGKREILLTDLRPNHVLARDLHNASGVVLLQEGRLITEATLSRLLVINRTRPLDQRVLVYS